MNTITKSDFLIYLEAPLHLWAKKHGQFKKEFSEFDIHLMNQGYKVENLAKSYLNSVIISQNETLIWQKEFAHQDFVLRSDALVFKPRSDLYDLYEIKSSTKVDKENNYDVTYQYVILSNLLKIDRLYVLHLNKEYVLEDQLDISHLFMTEDITDKVHQLSVEVEAFLPQVLKTAQSESINGIEPCYKPSDCPCTHLCHPNLPEFSIYDIPGIRKNKKKELLRMGIIKAKDIPEDFTLNLKQLETVQLAKTNKEYIDTESIRKELSKLEYPLHFLDYETCISALPLYGGYHPQQQIVFQYSLHRLNNPEEQAMHFEHISDCESDPSLPLLERLRNDIGEIGTVIVWNKSFEMTQNKEMAKLHPQFAGFLECLNNRIYDLGDFVNKGFYLHPGFKGSWSIKNVLPVLIPNLSYKKLKINKGGQASMAWWEMCFGPLDDDQKKSTKAELLKYCELDSKAMVELLRIFMKF